MLYAPTQSVHRQYININGDLERQRATRIKPRSHSIQYDYDTNPLLPPTKEEVNAFARVCLSVCLLARLLKNACTDLDEMFRVDRCRDMDKLINF